MLIKFLLTFKDKTNTTDCYVEIYVIKENGVGMLCMRVLEVSLA
jgi:hypothetical protein